MSPLEWVKPLRKWWGKLHECLDSHIQGTKAVISPCMGRHLNIQTRPLYALCKLRLKILYHRPHFGVQKMWKGPVPPGWPVLEQWHHLWRPRAVNVQQGGTYWNCGMCSGGKCLPGLEATQQHALQWPVRERCRTEGNLSSYINLAPLHLWKMVQLSTEKYAVFCFSIISCIQHFNMQKVFVEKLMYKYETNISSLSAHFNIMLYSVRPM